MRPKVKTLGAVTILTLFLCCGSSYAGREYTFPYQQEVSARGVERIYIDNTAGEVRLKPALDENRITVKAEKVVYEEEEKRAERLAEEIKIEVEKSGNTLRVETDYPHHHRRGGNFLNRLFRGWSHSYHVEYLILLPKKVGIEISTSSADVYGEKLENDLKLEGSSSDVSLEDYRGEITVEVSSGDLELVKVQGGLRLEGSSSEVDIDHFVGEVFIDNTSGDIRIYNLEGDLTVDNSSGDLFVKESRGEVRVTTSSGDISVRKHRGGVRITSASGDIEAELVSTEGKKQYLETSSGDVRLYLPEDAGGLLTVETVSGEIHSRLPLEASSISERKLRGRLGPGEAEVEVYTVSGDVGLSRR